ncbi:MULTISPECIES: hypothetical protein [Pseudomonas]|uniref:Uncharacterized protein n=1 Tax=Pseudomonas izuensis TaxID=2684212 RepID=A0ABM7RJW5_9PSED|nr:MULTISPECIES: hypothetical protein [Pseudomonas]RKS17777.1 hypothetical protein BJ917_4958 [Pseudomonas sp. WPR_5_2]BCX66279.1 hypothetical protein LAB08_R08940 [Pseudomonas izuensis]
MASDGLILQQWVSRDDATNLHCQETTLRLSEDCRQLVLSSYTEHYGPAAQSWIEHNHTVSVSDLLRWLMANGEAVVMKSDSRSLS